LYEYEGIYHHDQGKDITFDFSDVDDEHSNTFYRICLRLADTVTLTIPSTTFTGAASTRLFGVGVSQVTGVTLVLDPATNFGAQAAGVAVTQVGGATGILTTALSNTAVTQVVITTTSVAQFTATGALTIGSATELVGSSITTATDRVATGTLYDALPAVATSTVVVTKTNSIPFDIIHTILVAGNSEVPIPATVVVNSGYSYDLTAAVGKLLVSGWSTDKIRFYPKKDQSLTITESSVKESSNRFFDPLYDLIGFFRGGCPNSHSDWISKTLTASNSSSSLSAMGVETLTGGRTYTFDFSHVTDPFQYNMDFHICFYDKSQIVESATYVDLVYMCLRYNCTHRCHSWVTTHLSATDSPVLSRRLVPYAPILCLCFSGTVRTSRSTIRVR
jgi:hypothetical protein